MPRCRACTSTDLFLYLPLGDHPAANAFLGPEALDRPEPTWPLDTHACLACGLIQVPDQLPADFFEDYVYIPSASETMRTHFANLASQFGRMLMGRTRPLVVDIGCNDGTLLAACQANGLRALGVDPAANIVVLAREKGVEVVNQYFTSKSAAAIARDHGLADIIVTTNTFNHIDNLHDFMAGVAALLAPDGTMIIEVPQALTCIAENQFDTVYHEHLSVFTVTSVAALGQHFGLALADIEELPIHGGSMRLHLRRGAEPNPTVAQWLEREREAGLFDRQTYVDHATRVVALRQDLLAVLRRLKTEGKRLAGYGAPAKGNTLLNFCGIGPDLLEYLADRNPLKQGRVSPGMHIPVVDPGVIDRDPPDYLLVLAWNFADEILGQQAGFRAGGGQFILPIPTPRIVA